MWPYGAAVADWQLWRWAGALPGRSRQDEAPAGGGGGAGGAGADWHR